MTLARFIASGCGIGYAPVAPGTVASAVALAIGVGLYACSPLLLGAAALAATLGGTWAVEHARVEGDPGWVVVDEFAGQWLALLGAGALVAWQVAAAFALFRLLDITKPGPVGWADRRHGSFGIMADDVIAGLLAAGILLAARLALGA